MKRNLKKSFVLVLSIPALLSSIGYGSWVVSQKEAKIVASGHKVQDVPVAYIVGKEDIKYTKVERALEVAKSGDIVCLIPPQKPNYHPTNNTVVPDKVTYTITKDCTIKEGVTLVIPTDKNTFSTVNNASSLNSYITSMKEDDRSRGEIILKEDGTESTQKPSLGNYADEN